MVDRAHDAGTGSRGGPRRRVHDADGERLERVAWPAGDGDGLARIVEWRGSVAGLHALDPFADGPTRSQVWWCRAVRPGLALGSRQGDEVVDAAACARAGIDVTRRRSGGGAVLVDPVATIWVDVVVPPGVVPDDVRASMVAIGEWWLDAMQPWVDTESGDITLHRGGLVDTDWSPLACFAGVGPGEILVGDRKLVGLSQRRGRRGARIQGLIHLAEPAVDIAGLFAPPRPPGPAPHPAVLPALARPGAVEQLIGRLADRITTA